MNKRELNEKRIIEIEAKVQVNEMMFVRKISNLEIQIICGIKTRHSPISLVRKRQYSSVFCCTNCDLVYSRDNNSLTQKEASLIAVMTGQKTKEKPVISQKSLIDSLKRRVHFLEDSLRCLVACGHEFKFSGVEFSPVDHTVKLVNYNCIYCATEKTRTITQLSENERQKLAELDYSLRE